jgi:phosphopantetheine adenylyltransferase
VRSALSNAKQEQTSRRKHETEASIEQATVRGAAGASADVIQLEVFVAKRRRERAARAIETLREQLADDRIALGTVECIAKGKTEPAQQARILTCSVDEIYAARKRRKRVLEKILAAQEAEDDEEKT